MMHHVLDYCYRDLTTLKDFPKFADFIVYCRGNHLFSMDFLPCACTHNLRGDNITAFGWITW